MIKLLQQYATQLNLFLSESKRQKLLHYIKLIAQWNRVYNLTAVHASQDMLVRHIMESLALVAHIQGTRILDIGSGAGLPGIPLSIYFSQEAPCHSGQSGLTEQTSDTLLPAGNPSASLLCRSGQADGNELSRRIFVLLDSQSKRIRFLHHVQHSLALPNVEIIHQRVQDFAPEQAFDTLISRAVTSVPKLLAWSQHLCARQGQFVLLANKLLEPVRMQLLEEGYLVQEHTMIVPGLLQERNVVIIRRCATLNNR